MDLAGRLKAGALGGMGRSRPAPDRLPGRVVHAGGSKRPHMANTSPELIAPEQPVDLPPGEVHRRRHAKHGKNRYTR